MPIQSSATLLEVATLVGLDQKQVRIVAERVGIKPAGHGNWPLRECLTAIVDYYRHGSRANKDKLLAEQVRKMTADATIAEVEAEQKLATHIHTDEAAAKLERAFRTVAMRLNQLPESQLAVELAGASTAIDAKKILKKYVRETLADVAGAMKREFTETETVTTP